MRNTSVSRRNRAPLVKGRHGQFNTRLGPTCRSETLVVGSDSVRRRDRGRYVLHDQSRSDLPRTRHSYHQSWLERGQGQPGLDRKSTRLNSSHITISYAVFCLKKKKKKNIKKNKKKKKINKNKN